MRQNDDRPKDLHEEIACLGWKLADLQQLVRELLVENERLREKRRDDVLLHLDS